MFFSAYKNFVHHYYLNILFLNRFFMNTFILLTLLSFIFYFCCSISCLANENIDMTLKEIESNRISNEVERKAQMLKNDIDFQRKLNEKSIRCKVIEEGSSHLLEVSNFPWEAEIVYTTAEVKSTLAIHESVTKKGLVTDNKISEIFYSVWVLFICVFIFLCTLLVLTLDLKNFYKIKWKRLLLRFYRYFFSSKGRSKIKKAAYLLLFIWFMCVFVQRAVYPEYILVEWYYFFFTYPTVFYLAIFLLPWTRYTLFSKLRLFQVFICVSIFTLGTTLHSLHAFLILHLKPFTAYSLERVITAVLRYWFG